MEAIRSILLDADGVVQMPSPEWRARLEALAGGGEHARAFIADVFAAEEPCVTGRQDFAVALKGVLRKWQSDADVQDVLDVWTLIEPHPEVLQIVRDLRAQGRRVYLATNQQQHRASYMSGKLGYDALFDDCVYSCDLGCAKPDRAYFIEAIERLGIRGSQALFIDDRESNLAVARQVGLNAEQFHLTEGVETLRRTLRIYNIKLP